ncbi:hypothetical protein FEM08_30730 [Flavobacterium gilvum]|uniref:glycosyltransferase family 2 protein n=1 Tax=Flavobacterium gilvum TaxID=1492737 RepID=UPI0004E335B3|nr:glycosyltransferase family A protein [Flavobacterium gilvum]KFC58151.1 hypothetical protein FEM08_30730 [Flavobacterium gilvum]
MNNLVSIIIPTYNRAYLIGETLESIIVQSHENWECIIVDDGSTDNTASLISNYIKKDNRFQYHQRPLDRKKGANACRNYGFELSKGEYLKWFDSDDIMHPNFLEKQVQVLEQKQEFDFCNSLSKKFTKSVFDANENFNPEIIFDENSICNFIIGKLFFLTPSSLWRRKFLQDKLLFDETLYNAHETDFNFRRLIEGAKFCYLEDVLFYVRRGHSSIDSESINNPFSLQSQFDYFQKIFDYLNSENNFLDDVKTLQLKKYVMYRLIHFFYQLRLILGYKECINNFKIILKNLLSLKTSIFSLVRILMGIIIILFFKKGYNLISIKKYDI